jgi:hypothetical protein
MTPRQKILERIKALLAKTVENGCTEAEAMTALDKARDIMDAHDITDTDLAFGGEKVVQERTHRNDPDGIRFGLGLCGSVAKFCDCKAWGERNDRITFLGLESDAIFATWLLDTMEKYIRRQSLQFLAEMGKAKVGKTDMFGMPLNGFERERHRKSFILGCVSRICQRMDEATRARQTTTGSNGRALVVKKNALVETAWKALGIHLSKSRSRHVNADTDSFIRGMAAGDRANFGRPVGNHGGSYLAIGAG